MSYPTSMKTITIEPSASSDQVSASVTSASSFSQFLFPGISFSSVIQGASDMGARLSEMELQKSLDFCVNLFSPTCPEQHERVANSGLCTEWLDVNAPVIDPKMLEGALMGQMGSEEAKKVDGHVDGRLKVVKCSEKRKNGAVGLATISDDTEGEPSGDNKPAKLPPAVQRCDRRMKRSDSDAQKLAETKMVVNKINARRVVHSEYAINNLESEGLNGFVVRLEKGNLGLMKARAAGLKVR